MPLEGNVEIARQDAALDLQADGFLAEGTMEELHVMSIRQRIKDQQADGIRLNRPLMTQWLKDLAAAGRAEDLKKVATGQLQNIVKDAEHSRIPEAANITSTAMRKRDGH